MKNRKMLPSFVEAKSVFYDEKAILFFDEAHSNNEERFILLGLSDLLNILVVCHCYKENNKTIRIFSCRKATTKEQKYYIKENRNEK